MTLLGRIVAAVVEAVPLPSDSRDFDPLQFFGKRLFGRRLHHVNLFPVRTASGDAVDGILSVLRKRKGGEAPRAVGRKRVRIDQHFRGSVKPLLNVEDALILQSVVFEKEEMV